MSTRLIVRVANNKSSLSRAQFLLKKVLARERRLVQAGFKSARNLGVPAQVEKTAGRIPGRAAAIEIRGKPTVEMYASTANFAPCGTLQTTIGLPLISPDSQRAGGGPKLVDYGR